MRGLLGAHRCPWGMLLLRLEMLPIGTPMGVEPAHHKRVRGLQTCWNVLLLENLPVGTPMGLSLHIATSL